VKGKKCVKERSRFRDSGVTFGQLDAPESTKLLKVCRDMKSR